MESIQSRAIAFVDPRVENYQSLMAGIAPGTEVAILDPTRDGVEQIGELLASRSGISAIHILSHGGPGSLQLGSTNLSSNNLQIYASQLQGWAQFLTDDADILLYGCDVAADLSPNPLPETGKGLKQPSLLKGGQGGISFVQQLSKLTGADVAASNNLTGSAALDGDWNLEVATGNIETTLAFNSEVTENYNSILATINVTTFADEDNGILGGGTGVSLREAIRYSAAGDIINLPAGTYTLSLAGTGEEVGATGDLDITKNLTIAGAGAGTTTINAAGIDRAFHVTGAGITFNLSGVTITGGNVTDYGGGLYNNGGTLNVTNSTISNNTATSFTGGGIFSHNSGTLNVTNTNFSNNSANTGGGAISNGSNLTVSNSTFSGNSGNLGSGIYNFNGTANISNSNISGNSGGQNGGGIYNTGPSVVSLSDSTLANNAVTNDGGAIYNDTTVNFTLTNSTISGNSAGNWAGGILNDGTLNISNSTLSGNIGAQFGGIRNGGNLDIANSTIAFNSANSGGGGGVWTTGTIANVKNTIIAKNTALMNPDTDGLSFTSLGNNLIGDGTGGSFTNGINGDIVGTGASPIDPLLSPLQNNGGLTQTHLLLPGSAAIDAGNNAGAPATDQRGQTRITDGNGDSTAAIDIGATEARGNTFPVAVADTIGTVAGAPVKINVLSNDTDAEGDYIRVVDIAANPTNGTVTINDEVYAGGFFSNAGGVGANNIAKWDGTTWSALGAGVNSPVNALAFSGGKLYVGGLFTSPGNYIAQWDGTAWSPLGAGVNNRVNAIATSGNNVYVGGNFTNAGGANISNIARWDGSNWSALGAGTNAEVNEIVLSGINLYAGGSFTTAGGVGANRIAQWNGSNWSALAAGLGLDSPVNAIATSGNNIYAGGDFTSADLAIANYIAQWNGSSWSGLGSGMDSPVNAIAISGSNVYAGGDFFNAGGGSVRGIAQWNGASWSALGAGIDNDVFAIALDTSNNLYVGGVFDTAGGINVNKIAKWDGSNWSALGTGTNGRVSAIAIDPGRSITYTPTTPGFNGIDTFQYTISDGQGGTSTNTVNVVVNQSPVLDNTSNLLLTNVNFNDVTNQGNLISEILASGGSTPITDADAGATQGIAIIAQNTANGTWQYTTNGGTNWNAFPAVSANNALLLSSNPNTRIRFIPNSTFVGTLANAITFHAWDGITGTNGGVADVATDLTNNGASSVFSLGNETANITVNPIISINDVPVIEGNSGTINATFTVSLNGASTQPITVDYATANNTATAGSDYAATSGTLTFNPGETSKTVTVAVNGDNVSELDETFFVNLSNATNAKIADIQAIGTITDDDTVGFTVTPISSNTSENGDSASFTVALTSQPTADVTIGVSSSNSAEGIVSIPSLTFTAANWNLPQTVTVTGVDDAALDGNIPYAIALSPANSTDANYNSLDPADVAVINTDNDSPAVLISQINGSTDITEGGTNDTYTVVLATIPTGNAIVTVTPDAQIDLGAGAGNPVNLTFTPSNWNAAQTINVVAVDDTLAEGNHNSTITHAVAAGSAAEYLPVTIGNVIANITDNDSPGVSITQSGGSTDITEGGSPATYTVVLTTQPSSNVTVAVTPDAQIDLGAGAGNPVNLTFTSANWNAAQTINVAAVDDTLAEGDRNSTITHTVIAGSAAEYLPVTIGNVTANITDNDSPGVSITQSGGSTDITEGGSPATYTLVLTTQPTGNVIVAVTPDAQIDLGAGAGNPVNLTFTSANWNAAQTINVAAVDDTLAQGDRNTTITHAIIAGSAAEYLPVTIGNVTANITDNDSPGVSITQSGGSTDITEGGIPATYTVVLTTQPTGNVIVAVTPDAQIDLGAGAGNPVNLTFTSSNWNAAQTVNVTAFDDTLAQGDRNTTITHAIAAGSAAEYLPVTIGNVTANITDNDSPGISIAQSGGSTDITEGGSDDTYTVVLTTAPTAEVTVNFTTDSQLNAIAPITFNSTNWNVAQTVTVKAVDDLVAQGNRASTISHTIQSADANYNGINISDVVANITDNDSPGVSIAQSGGSTDITEGGSADTYTVVLTTAPTAPVTINFTTDSQLNSIAPITFNSTNWNVAQTVTVKAVDDTLAQGDRASTISHTIQSADANYNNIAIADVVANITDNDSPGISITPTSTNATEGGANGSYKVVLTSAPKAPVLVNFNTDAQIQAIPAIAFNSTNWNVAQTITVAAVNDAIAEGFQNSTISHAVQSADASYNGINISNVVTSITDDDSPGISIAPLSTNAVEGGANASYAVSLTTAPTAPVTINFNSDSQVQEIPPIVFDSFNWNVPRIINVAAVDDALAQGERNTTITHAVSSADANYNGMAIADFIAAIADNDKAGISITPTSVNATEGGANGTYAIALSSAPKAPVVINFTTDNQLQSIPSISFDNTNWNVPKTLTVSAVNDAIAEGNQISKIRHTVQSADADYNGIALNDVAASITDNDAPGVSIFPNSISATEGGVNGSYNIVLTTAPKAPVTINFTTDSDVYAIAPITFDSTNWNRPQTVAAIAVDDPLSEGNQTSIITHQVTSADADYNGIGTSEAIASITDNDPAGVPITLPVGSIDLIEGFGEDIYKLALTNAPTSNVTIQISTDGKTTTDVQTLTFTTQNWNIAKPVKIKAVDDAIIEGLHKSTISFVATSENQEYNGLAIANIIANISDNDNLGRAIALPESSNFASGESDDTIVGSEENDIINGRNGSDRLEGGNGDDILYGANGSDGIAGGDGNDQIYGGADTDYINGNAGDDLVFAGTGSDRVRGGAGNDLLFGEEGNDYLFGDLGADTLTGGLGSDVFAIGSGTGGKTLNSADIITDFKLGEDKIDLISPLTLNQLTIYQGTGAFANDTLIQELLTGEYLAVLQGVVAGSLNPGSFI